jgi:hypothetical protein
MSSTWAAAQVRARRAAGSTWRGASDRANGHWDALFSAVFSRSPSRLPLPRALTPAALAAFGGRERRAAQLPESATGWAALPTEILIDTFLRLPAEVGHERLPACQAGVCVALSSAPDPLAAEQS